MTESVSVVVPVYNRAGTIRRALQSVLAQDYPIAEVIVVDDGSTDDTVAVVRALDQSKIRIERSLGRTGATRARNLGIEVASGDWVAFQDSDDFWMPDKLGKQMAALALQPTAAACYCQLVQLFASSLKIIPAGVRAGLTGDLLPELIQDSFISTQTLVCRTDALRAVNGFDNDMPRLQDWDLVLRLARLGVMFTYVAEPLAVAYDTPGSLTSNAMRGVDARERVLAKHADLIDRFPAAIARHHFIMGSLCLKAGQAKRAHVHALAATRLRPKSAKYIAFAAFATAHRLSGRHAT